MEDIDSSSLPTLNVSGGMQAVSFLPLGCKIANEFGKKNISYQTSISSVHSQPSRGDSHRSHSDKISNREKIKEIEMYLSKNCARHIKEPQRSTNVKKMLEDMMNLFPLFSSVFLFLRRYLKDIFTNFECQKNALKSEIENLENSSFKKFEQFFENKFLQLLKQNKKLEREGKQMRDVIFMLRKERDEDLMCVKEEVMARLNDCQRKEDDFTSFRKLIASVFKTNEKLVNRVDDLETILKKHGIDVPAAHEDLFVYNKPESYNGSSYKHQEDVKKLRDQVSLEFIEASRKEMNLARLSLQRELLHSAFDDRSAYRLQVNGLRNDNALLQNQIEALQYQVLELEKYIHEKRFAFSNEDNSGNGIPLTPRPRDVPFAIQTDLGIDLRKSTADIVLELSAVGTNLKHQLNSAVMTLRQMTSAVEWIDEETLLKIVDESNLKTMLPTFPTSSWSTIPHFLRTHVEPDIANLRWSDVEIAYLLNDFFLQYYTLRKSCKYTRDSKMLVPRHYQLFERCQQPMVKLDATVKEMEEDEENVPFGYVVSFFVLKILKTNSSDSPYFHFIQPGTLNPTFSSFSRSGSSTNVTPVELEFTKFSYNIWYSAQRYKEQQPLCRLFIDILDGRLSVKLFDIMEHVLSVVEGRINKADTDGSCSFTYNKLVNTVLKLVADMDAQVGRCAILSVMETFKANKTPLIGGRLFISSILSREADMESRNDSHLTSRLRQSLSIINSSSNIGSVPSKGKHTAAYAYTRRRSLMNNNGPQGASVFVRFWRRLVIQRYEREYDLLERVVGALVVESQVVIGLFLLPVTDAINTVRDFDIEFEDMTEEDINKKYPILPEQRKRFKSNEPLSENGILIPEPVRLTEEYGKHLEVHKNLLHENKRISLEEVLLTALKDTPLLSYSMHFPSHEKEMLPTSHASPSPAEAKIGIAGAPMRTEEVRVEERRESVPPKRKKKKSKGKGNKKEAKEDKSRTTSPPPSPEIISSQMIVGADKDLAEWYGFCATLRQTVFKLHENIFLDDVSFPGDTMHTSIKSTESPTLQAEDSSSCTSS